MAEQKNRETMTSVLDAMSNRIAGGVRVPLPSVLPEQVTADDETIDDGQVSKGGVVDEYTPNFPGDDYALEVPNTSNRSGALSWGGHANGYIPPGELSVVQNGIGLESAAAHAFTVMVADAKAEGVDISITDGYRSFDQQVTLRATKGDRVATATPGKSVHGWGKAIDAGTGLEWLQKNGARYGWVWPTWAQRKGTKQFEPWHFEFRPTGVK